jgi:3-ketosteroid 9alpha-monooxygenase subunit B
MRGPHAFHRLRIARVVQETADTRSFVLTVPPELAAAFAYRAGQYCTFRSVIDGAEVVRCYSMSSSPSTDEPLTVTVKRVAGGAMSNWMIDSLAAGDEIDVTPPSGRFVLHDDDTTPLIAFAGGSGITPIKSIIEYALHTTTRSITLVDANRDAEAVIFAEALQRLASQYRERFRVHHHLDSVAGFLVPQAVHTFVDTPTAACYVCGPAPFMQVVETGLRECGIADERIFIERFVDAAIPAGDEVAVGTELSGTATTKVVIKLERSTHTIDYQAGDTLLATARRAGLRAPFSCEAGHCATCMAHLQEGSVRMRNNQALSDEEVADGWVLTCQSVPQSPTVIVDYDT